MRRPRLTRALGLGLLAVTAATFVAAPVSAHGNDRGRGHQVFQASNDPAGNAIQVFDQAADGTLVAGPLVPTGGLGSGDSLGSQGAVVRDGNHVLVVNAGDSTVSSFVLRRGALELRDVEPSGGVRPVSVTVADGAVYVLNAGDDTISGLRLRGNGRLDPIAGTTLPLSGTATGAAQIQFHERTRSLIVTEKAANVIDVFQVGRSGRVTGPQTFASSGAVPYGFDIDRRGHVVVSEAASGAVSSYRLGRSGLSVITPTLADTQAAPCWLEIGADGRFAYTTNAGSATISSYAIGRDGSLTLVAPVAAATSAGPTDIAQSSDGAYLYVRMRSGSVGVYAVNGDGTLTSVGEYTGAPTVGVSGLAAI